MKKSMLFLSAEISAKPMLKAVDRALKLAKR